MKAVWFFVGSVTNWCNFKFSRTVTTAAGTSSRAADQGQLCGGSSQPLHLQLSGGSSQPLPLHSAENEATKRRMAFGKSAKSFETTPDGCKLNCPKLRQKRCQKPHPRLDGTRKKPGRRSRTQLRYQRWQLPPLTNLLPQLLQQLPTNFAIQAVEELWVMTGNIICIHVVPTFETGAVTFVYSLNQLTSKESTKSIRLFIY